MHQGGLIAESSPVLHAFLRATHEVTDPQSLLSHFQRLSAAPLSPAIAASMSAIYCYWRVEQELFNFTAELQRWHSDEIQGRLLRVLGGLPGADEAGKKEQLQDFFRYAARELSLRLRGCTPFVTCDAIPTGLHHKITRTANRRDLVTSTMRTKTSSL